VKASAAAPCLPGLGSPQSSHFLLARLEGQRRLHVIRGGADLQRWVRAYARRWLVVAAATEAEAREAAAGYEKACGRRLSHYVNPARYGVVEAGRNAPGGPRSYPHDLAAPAARPAGPPRRSARDREVLRPAPAARARRRTRARGPTPSGVSVT
jgi:hypothetical protein